MGPYGQRPMTTESRKRTAMLTDGSISSRKSYSDVGSQGTKLQGQLLTPITVLGVRISRLSLSQAIDAVDALAQRKDNCAVFILNAHTLNLACVRPGYRNVLNSADLVLNDGVGLEIAARLQGSYFPANLVGTDFVPELCRLAAKSGYVLYLLGGVEGVAEKASQALVSRLPGLVVAGWHHGFFDKAACPEVLDAIRRANPDLLLVGFGNPLQEEWICRFKDELPGCVALGVGALFHFLAGVEPRAPALVRRMRCEWVFRLLVAPRKKWRRYVLGNPQFLWRICKERFVGAGEGLPQ